MGTKLNRVLERKDINMAPMFNRYTYMGTKQKRALEMEYINMAPCSIEIFGY